MNKTAIKNFAIWARNKLIADIQYKAGLMGITEKGIANALPQSTRGTEFYDIGTSEPYTISGKEIEQRRRLKEVIENKASDTDYSTAYKYVIEEVAYTWFNRLIAVRFMEVNDYLPGHIRVLSSETGKMEPDLVTTPFDADLEFTSTEEEQIIQLKQDNKIDELFRMLFIKQCNALNELLPALFEKTNDYTEILLNLSVIDQEGVVYHLVHDISEEDFDVNRGGQVEIIGWLYQYYNTEPKNDAFAKKGKITKEEIPAVTQLFTPDWIVRYMVENSLGRLWLEGHPDEALKEKWKYYLDEAEQEPEVQTKLDTIKEEYKKLNPEDIKLIDPCMGSGHILVYAFDVLMQIYESAGWSQRDAAKSIVENNIYGLDIDDRAFQMAYFAVMMKARQYNRRILNSDMNCHMYAIQESNGITTRTLNNMGTNLTDDEYKKASKQVKQIIDLFKNAKEYGSIINVPQMDWELIRKFVVIKQNDNEQMTLDIYGEGDARKRLSEIINIAEIMSNKYFIAITNPPYMGSGSMQPTMVKYLKEKYPDSKNDLFAVFIERCTEFLDKNGIQAMITQQAWMFLSSYENLRLKLFDNIIVNMAHLGTRAFEEIAGEVVQTTSFVVRKSNLPNYKGVYIRLVDGNSQQEKERLFLNPDKKYISQSAVFKKVPGALPAYWITEKFASIFDEKTVESTALKVCKGGFTGNNDKYLRLWFEVDYNTIPQKWNKYSKGGSFRRWYGNSQHVIYWANDGKILKNDPKAGMGASQYYGKKHLVWSGISTGLASFRYEPQEVFFDDVSPAVVFSSEFNWQLLGLLNCKVATEVLKIIAPTMHFQAGDIKAIPIVNGYRSINENVIKENVNICKTEWDLYENSWDYVRHPLVENVAGKAFVSNKYEEWEMECLDRFAKLKANEEELNQIFIELYGLQNELVSEVEEKDVTVRKADLQREIKSLISYAVGCMLGRYSLDCDGLAYAGGTFDGSKYETFIPDVDGIIPITDEEYFEDDIVGLFCAWLKKVYGEETLEENLDFIAKALGKKGNSSREIIRNYFLTDFYKDHCSTYSVTGSGKRPIYWLFDSGKQNGFKALIYLHRYTPDTIGNLRVDYLHRMQRVYESEMNRMQDMIEHSTNSREVASASKRKEKLQKQLKECREYDEKIGHLALDRIELDLDDGVKYNYRKIQTGRDGKFYEVLADSKAIMMDAKKYADFKK
ncbi:BREX-1 system adenine-specific DNA-methyltransferase PglX [Blautia sp. HCP28S3_G10]|uniref:BREX-1 system adenine-specific DNA-methyltransferase PglX n=1 Tax=Blautia sp. HCP28S3_G10 TaxID=3438908 RepID=UPI003F8C05FB